MITLFTVANHVYSREAKKTLLSFGQEVLERKIHKDPITLEELCTLLASAENGVMDIIGTKSAPYKQLSEDGVNFEELTLKQFHALCVMYPRLLRLPIAIDHKRMRAGFNDDDYRMFMSREMRQQHMNRLLPRLQRDEIQRHLGLDHIIAGHEAK